MADDVWNAARTRAFPTIAAPWTACVGGGACTACGRETCFVPSAAMAGANMIAFTALPRLEPSGEMRGCAWAGCDGFAASTAAAIDRAGGAGRMAGARSNPVACAADAGGG